VSGPAFTPRFGSRSRSPVLPVADVLSRCIRRNQVVAIGSRLPSPTAGMPCAYVQTVPLVSLPSEDWIWHRLRD
jgi:hypothetical protein